MATTTLHTLPLDDSECAMLRDLAVSLTYGQGYDLTGDDGEDLLALMAVGYQFLNAAAVLRMVQAGEANAETWLPVVLRGYERETAELVDDLLNQRDGLREEFLATEQVYLASARTFLLRCEAA